MHSAAEGPIAWSEPLAAPAHLGLNMRLGPVPEHLPYARVRWDWLEAADGSVLVRFGDHVRLLVEDGKTATVQLDALQEEWAGDPSWILQGWAVTIACLQRGDLSLHASIVDIGGSVVAIAGGRGAGKSTTSMGLRGRGHRLLTDDVTLVELRHGEAWTTPYARNVHLLPDTAAAIGLDFSTLTPLAGGRNKSAFAPEPPDTRRRRLDGVVVLTAESAAREVSLQEAHGATRVLELSEHTERDGIAPLILGEEVYFRRLTALAAACPVALVRRPVEGWTLEEVLDAIERQSAVFGVSQAGNG